MVFRKFRFGKYKGKEICGIAMTHTGYILWLLENTQFKLNELEQECFDAVAKAKAEGSTNFVYNKEDLKKHIKDKGIKTPFVSHKGYFGIHNLASINFVHQLQHLLFCLGLNSEMEV